MIRYSLKCEKGCTFDSWFQSSEAFDKLDAAGMIACAVCGCTDVEKAVMAPRLSSGEGAEGEGAPLPARPLSAPMSEIEASIQKLRTQIEKTSDYVGAEFAAEARRIHEGDADPRAIYGEATREDARALLEDGVPVAPIPIMTRRGH